MSGVRVVVEGCGSYLPERVMTNDELARRLDTSDEWIVQRTGIRRRHIAAEGERSSDLAAAAARAALADAGRAAGEVDLIVVATATPDHTFPATATQVQHKLGMEKGFAFDVQAVCTGFVYALATAGNFLRAGQGSRALVIGAETFSRILDWEDRSTCVLFGDGAGALVVSAVPEDGAGGRGLIGSRLYSDGRYLPLLYVDGGPSSGDRVGHLRMEGREIFRHGVAKISEAILDVLAQTGLTSEDIDWFVPHQANIRILEAVARKISLPREKIIITIADHANTSAASVPLALDQGRRDGRIKQGDLVMLEAMGGGLTWGAAALRW